jgi:hypothetical protein
MNIIIGSARVDERGTYSGGTAGDQKQGNAVPDMRGEVSMQSFYVHRKGWYVIRPKDANIARGIAAAMKQACNNPNIGYDQAGRYGILTYGTNTKVKTEADCSSLVRQCVKEASGKDPGDFTTWNEVQALNATGLFEPARAYTSSVKLYEGDVLVTKTKGHTVIVTDGYSRSTQVGWYKQDGKWRYVLASGKDAKGWQALAAKNGMHWYYFNDAGNMLTGWQEINGEWYFLDEDIGGPNEGACWISDSSGAMHVWFL